MSVILFLISWCFAFGSIAFASEDLVCVEPNNEIAREFRDIRNIAEKLEFLSQPDPNTRFNFACQTRESNLTKPDVWWLQRSVPESDSNSIEAKDFLRTLLKRIETIGQENVNISENIQACMKPGSSGEICSGIRDWIEADGGLKFKIEEARFHLALSQGPGDIYSSQGAPSPNLNTRLKSSGIYKYTEWEPLTKDEEKNTRAVFKAEQKAIKDDLKKKGYDLSKFGGRRVMRDRFLKIRLAHWEEYKNVLETVPFMQFISSANPSDEEIASAASQQGELAKKELERIRGWIKDLEGPNSEVSPEMLQSLDYKMLVEEVLLANPKYCGIASGLMEVKEQRAIGNTAAVIAPIALLSFFVPPLAAVGAGIAGSSVLAAQSYSEFNTGKEMALSEVVAEKGAPGPGELNDLKGGVIQELTVGMALNAIGAGVIGRTSKAVSRTQRVIGSVAKKEPMPHYAMPEVAKRPAQKREIILPE